MTIAPLAYGTRELYQVVSPIPINPYVPANYLRLCTNPHNISPHFQDPFPIDPDIYPCNGQDSAPPGAAPPSEPPPGTPSRSPPGDALVLRSETRWFTEPRPWTFLWKTHDGLRALPVEQKNKTG